MHGMALLLGKMREISAGKHKAASRRHIKEMLNALMNRSFNRKL